jgi:orotidine-5'-phosphate decarboxylase
MKIEEPIIALDFQNWAAAVRFLDRFPKDEHLFVKVGMELFYAAGSGIARELKARGCKVFLDLKLHDIPNTVEASARVLAGLGVDMLTIHAAGGSKMIAAARKGLSEGAAGTTPLLLAVTELTSTSTTQLHDELMINRDMTAAVLHLAQLAKANGADGAICSAFEADALRQQLGKEFLRVTPGIRPVGGSKGDQQRVATPGTAAGMGSSALVVGRPITQAADPVQAYHQIKKAWEENHD